MKKGFSRSLICVVEFFWLLKAPKHCQCTSTTIHKTIQHHTHTTSMYSRAPPPPDAATPRGTPTRPKACGPGCGCTSSAARQQLSNRSGWRDKLFARVISRQAATYNKLVDERKRQLLGTLVNDTSVVDVLEVGIGSGANLPFYGPARKVGVCVHGTLGTSECRNMLWVVCECVFCVCVHALPPAFAGHHPVCRGPKHSHAAVPARDVSNEQTSTDQHVVACSFKQHNFSSHCLCMCAATLFA